MSCMKFCPLLTWQYLTKNMLLSHAAEECWDSYRLTWNSRVFLLYRTWHGSCMKITSICLGKKEIKNTGIRGQGTLLVIVSQRENSHELVVPANALWDVWFCNTDSLRTNEEDKQRRKETFNSVKLANKVSNEKHEVKERLLLPNVKKRQLERSPKTKRVCSQSLSTTVNEFLKEKKNIYISICFWRFTGKISPVEPLTLKTEVCEWVWLSNNN